MNRLKNRNVLHVCSSYAQNDLYNQLISRLTNFGIENKVFVPVQNEVNKDYGENIIIKKCFNYIDRFFFLIKQYKIMRKLVERVENLQNFDLIHAHYLFTDGNVAYRLKKAYNIPYIVAVRNTDVNVFFKYRINLRQRGVKILLEASKIIVLSPSYINNILKYVPEKHKENIKNKMVVVPNGINEFWFRNTDTKQLNSSNINIVFAGRIDKNKNLVTALKAIDLLRKCGYSATYHFAGKIADKKIYDYAIRKDYVTYHGVLPKEKLIDLYRACDIFLMPSYYETFGLVYAEAMSQGLPVIYTKDQGFDNQFKDGIVGYAVNPKDEVEIKDKIIKVINNFSFISNNCAKYVHKFNWDTIAEIYYEIYNKIISG